MGGGEQGRDIVSDITSRAMLVNLCIRVWGATKTDRAASREVTRGHAADANAARVVKRLIGKDAIDKVKIIATEARTFHYANTLPWTYKGVALLVSDNFMAYTTAMRSFRNRIEDAVEALVADYDNEVDKAKKSLGSMFNQSDYPTARAIRSLFGFDTKIFQVPEAGDFRVELSKDAVADIRRDMETDFSSGILTARTAAYGRLREVVAKFKAKMDEGGVKVIFRDSIIGNMAEACELLPRLLVVPDADFMAIVANVKQELVPLNLKKLRKNRPDKGSYHSPRELASNECSKILSRIEQAMVKGGLK
jgi:hypothetical protein